MCASSKWKRREMTTTRKMKSLQVFEVRGKKGEEANASFNVTASPLLIWYVIHMTNFTNDETWLTEILWWLQVDGGGTRVGGWPLIASKGNRWGHLHRLASGMPNDFSQSLQASAAIVSWNISRAFRRNCFQILLMLIVSHIWRRAQSLQTSQRP